MFDEIRSALYGSGVSQDGLKVVNYIYGLGGREINESHIESVYDELKDILHTGLTGADVRYLGLRESNVEQIVMRLEEQE